MNEHMLHDYQHYMTSLWIISTLILLVFALLFFRFGRRHKAPQQTFLNASDHIKSHKVNRPKRIQSNNEYEDDIEAYDTIFIVPDISHYTKFIAGNHFSAARSQQIIFSLINAMIEASTDTFELSKFEGDAVLLFADARKHSAEKIGQKVISIFDAFFEEKSRQMELGNCSCETCGHIADLDIKIFVHRGKAARFSFRGSIDHFGADVIILHRLMKNGVDGDRYIMVTDAARESISLKGNFLQQIVEEDVKDVGRIRATVHKFEIQSHLTNQTLGATQ